MVLLLPGWNHALLPQGIILPPLLAALVFESPTRISHIFSPPVKLYFVPMWSCKVCLCALYTNTHHTQMGRKRMDGIALSRWSWWGFASDPCCSPHGGRGSTHAPCGHFHLLRCHQEALSLSMLHNGLAEKLHVQSRRHTSTNTQ